MAASPKPWEGTPPPVIGKAGRYTVFITPPPTPRPSSNSPKPPTSSPRSIPRPRPVNAAAFAVKDPTSPPPPPVQVPPQQFEKPASQKGSASSFGFFWDAIAKVQDVHSSLDEYLADWFGLNQSKYQWALNDYYESKGLDKDDSKRKELATKDQAQ
ncbi:rho GTPase-activating protein 17-like [Dioscorea cayenensis subsp. rotundata]|uniref:Rho GTPase-activating protein 17-like n=1 Tax=Dioscorea cayennensis subsp. rotundata TaxID=55577 RepID=A0AB40ASC1_DIOCR|nr:rho GTPase-activating protein 17-like [Dioscorea cayenensis subsp. rotundata]